ncbi:PAN domain-containing protein [Aspergillus clavatus NRRL 1]|uniref:Hypothetical low complexity protein n=1 Tax=Aspergillus clavatus (strain ATCC 1007 / CBS 513.65 / DSM 816 / NCTC 3887 / NRRL 1 / QM 1276 / 107) TaxID=344612 RepID=A1CCE8_ASPCL|nr:putative low complexity protein [Aspergillus clavatus NRRL 1]EAW12205.1 hypothetical low complexity protein [Aspergillus clavatus NRRL 1]
MGRWTQQLLLPALAVLTPLSSALEITRTFTTTFPTSTVVTSSSAVAGCTVASSLDITCGNGYSNSYGAVWQETCSATITGGSIVLTGLARSLRACISACAVRSTCSATSYDQSSGMCYLYAGDVTITPGGPYQAALRYAPTASPCVSTWLVTETGTGTSTWESVYTVTPSPIASPSLTPSPQLVASTPLSPSVSPSVIPTPSSTPSVQVTTPSPPSSSTPLIHSSDTTSTSTSSPVASPPVQSSSIPLIRTSTLSTVSPVSPSVIPSVIPSPPSTNPSVPSGSVPSSGNSPSGPGASGTQSATGASAALPNTGSVNESSSKASSSHGSAGNSPSTTIYTVTTTQVHTITSCAATVTNCPAHQQTTYLTTETLIYTTTVCPEATSSGTHATGAPTAIPQPGVTHTAIVPSEQAAETALPPAHMTTSTVYVTEIDVITACPPSVHNCPASEKSTYTTTKTVAAYTTTFLVAVTDSPSVAGSEASSVHAAPASTLIIAQPLVPGHGSTGNYTVPQAPSLSTLHVGATSSGSSMGATHATTMNTVSWQGAPSGTVTAPGALFTGGASQIGGFSALSAGVAVLSMIFLL